MTTNVSGHDEAKAFSKSLSKPNLKRKLRLLTDNEIKKLNQQFSTCCSEILTEREEERQAEQQKELMISQAISMLEEKGVSKSDLKRHVKTL